MQPLSEEQEEAFEPGYWEIGEHGHREAPPPTSYQPQNIITRGAGTNNSLEHNPWHPSPLGFPWPTRALHLAATPGYFRRALGFRTSARV